MPHVDPDELGIIAMGERAPSTGEQLHLLACRECADELGGLRAVVGIVRDAGTDHLDAPPPAVWSAIAAQTGITADGGTAPTPPSERGAAGRTGHRWPQLAVAAAVGLLLGGIVTGAVTMPRTTTPGSSVLATAELSPVANRSTSGTGSGRASIEQVDGRDVLEVDTLGLAPTGGYYEVWLMDPTTAGLVSLGTVAAGGHATLPVPDTLRISDYSVVDISDEPLDGDPVHSKVSVLRGTLDV
jgi:Anti-sigma-K factor rskA